MPFSLIIKYLCIYLILHGFTRFYKYRKLRKLALINERYHSTPAIHKPTTISGLLRLEPFSLVITWDLGSVVRSKFYTSGVLILSL